MWLHVVVWHVLSRTIVTEITDIVSEACLVSVYIRSFSVKIFREKQLNDIDLKKIVVA